MDRPGVDEGNSTPGRSVSPPGAETLLTQVGRIGAVVGKDAVTGEERDATDQEAVP